MEINEYICLYLITYVKESKIMTEALEEITQEETDTARLCMKEKRSFTQLAAKDSLSIYFIYIPDVETFLRFNKEFLTSDRQPPLHFIVICSEITHELMTLSYKYKIRALAFIDSANSTYTCKREIKECIDYVRTIQTHLEKRREMYYDFSSN